jgi:HK97 family phage major capsid protein
MHDDNALPLDRAFDMLDTPMEIKSRTPAAGSADATAFIGDLARAIDNQTTAITNLTVKSAAPAKARPNRTPAEVRARVQTARALRELRETTERQKRRPDALDEAKSRRINAALDGERQSVKDAEIRDLRAQVAELAKKAARPAGPSQMQARDPAAMKNAAFALYRKSLDHYMRTGETTYQGRSFKQIQDAVIKLDTKDFNASVGPEGGFFVQPEHDTGPLEALLKRYSPMRELASVRTISSASFKRYAKIGGAAMRWVGEKTATSEDATARYAELDFPAMTALSEPRVSLEALEDSAIDPEMLVSEEAVEEIAQGEGAAFVSGDGDKKPRGFLGYDFVADASWAWAKVGYLATGADGAFASTGPGDVIKRAPLALKKAHRQNASWLMNRSTIGSVRTMRGSDGHYLWSEGDMSKGIPATLDGFRVDEDEEMPDIASNAHAIAFGDWKTAYQIVDRVGFQVFRNPYLAYPQVVFHVRKRVGGGVKNFQAFKTIKFAAS